MALPAGEGAADDNIIENPAEKAAENTPAVSGSSALGRMLHRNAARTAERRRTGELETRRSRRRRSSWRFILPSLIGVSVFFLVPFMVVVYYSLVNNPVQHVFVGTENYVRILQNPAFLTAARNTLVFSLISASVMRSLALNGSAIRSLASPWEWNRTCHTRITEATGTIMGLRKKERK